MMIEDALDRFLDHVPPIEDLVGERFDEMRVRFDRLERNMQMMAETVTLHARYHLALMPVLPQSRQHEASRVYDRYSRIRAALWRHRLEIFGMFPSGGRPGARRRGRGGPAPTKTRPPNPIYPHPPRR